MEKTGARAVLHPEIPPKKRPKKLPNPTLALISILLYRQFLTFDKNATLAKEAGGR
jgi:hypothetical protein